MRQGQEQTVEIHNGSSDPEIVHWHGLFLPSDIDGAMEEGTPMIDPGASVRYNIKPDPPGFRWFHTHTFAGKDLTKAQYSGLHGFLMIEPRDNPGRYDQEVFLALHDWRGHFEGGDDGYMNPGLRCFDDQRQDARIRRTVASETRRPSLDACA
jgi:FtsP/CotA-like multicopper oxidase with cupredoxin domain